MVPYGKHFSDQRSNFGNWAGSFIVWSFLVRFLVCFSALFHVRYFSVIISVFSLIALS